MRAYASLLLAALARAEPTALLDAPYEEMISTKFAYAGSPALGGGTLPFSSPVRQAMPVSGAGAVVRTESGELWRIYGQDRSWLKLSASTLGIGAGAVLLTSADSTELGVAHVGGVTLLRCGSEGCTARRAAALDEPRCASGIIGGSYDAQSRQLVVGCAAGLYLGEASEPSSAPRALARVSEVGDAAVLWAGSWADHVAAATVRRRALFCSLGASPLGATRRSASSNVDARAFHGRSIASSFATRRASGGGNGRVMTPRRPPPRALPRPSTTPSISAVATPPAAQWNSR